MGLITIGVSLSLLSCNSAADKAKKIEDGLSQNGKVLYKDVESKNPQMVVSFTKPDSSIVTLRHDPETDKVDHATSHLMRMKSKEEMTTGILNRKLLYSRIDK